MAEIAGALSGSHGRNAEVDLGGRLYWATVLPHTSHPGGSLSNKTLHNDEDSPSMTESFDSRVVDSSLEVHRNRVLLHELLRCIPCRVNYYLPLQWVPRAR